MKLLKIILSCFSILFFTSCVKDDATTEKAKFAVPSIKTLTEIRNNITVSGAKQTNSDGKIYVSENYLFYISKEVGIHVFNNQNPSLPVNTAFINLEGVHDISVKGNYLYADNFVDLLVFDISNISNITLVKTVENSLLFYPTYPVDAEFYDYSVNAGEGEIITGFTVQLKNRPLGQELILANDALSGFESAAPNSVGTGGSYARFQINNNALYTLDSYQLNVFNITNPIETFFDKVVYMNGWFGGGAFETLFIQKEILFVGSTTGMFTVDANDEFNPYFVSGFSHATACDPVVVFGNTAYITVRGGSSCGAIEDQVNVIDVTDISNPTLISTSLVNQPYGLGIKNGVLYVCCGSNGLKIFDASNSSNLTLENTYSEDVKDVIPLDNHLIVLGTNKIIQYEYGTNFSLIQLSEINF
ncbi:LVIVD repeat-containing protein [Flavobacterium sp.]|uniref:LVIVD repeat-containing protein n=1 Tax=Flavobacterium sp. TaxID=239 RepID=UPI003753BDE3